MTTLVLAAHARQLPLAQMARAWLAAMAALLLAGVAAAPRVVLLVLSAPLYAAGRATFALLLGSVVAARWCRCAVGLGWREARARAQARGTEVPGWLQPRGQA